MLTIGQLRPPDRRQAGIRARVTGARCRAGPRYAQGQIPVRLSPLLGAAFRRGAGAAAYAHRIDAAVPTVEIADDAYPGGGGRPDGEQGSVHALRCPGVGAEKSIGVQMPSFAEQVKS